MAWTQEDLDAIEEALADPARDIYLSSGERMTKRSVPDLLRIRSLILQSLGNPARILTRWHYSSGLDSEDAS